MAQGLRRRRPDTIDPTLLLLAEPDHQHLQYRKPAKRVEEESLMKFSPELLPANRRRNRACECLIHCPRGAARLFDPFEEIHDEGVSLVGKQILRLDLHLHPTAPFSGSAHRE